MQRHAMFTRRAAEATLYAPLLPPMVTPISHARHAGAYAPSPLFAPDLAVYAAARVAAAARARCRQRHALVLFDTRASAFMPSVSIYDALF